MTGEGTFQDYKYIISRDSLLNWIENLKKYFNVIGPVKKNENTFFKKLNNSDDIYLDYSSTMLSPGKVFIYEPYCVVCNFVLSEEIILEEPKKYEEKQILFAIHPCDTHAIFYLDKTFLGKYKDTFYERKRNNTLIVTLNCSTILPECFCSSVNTGPFLNRESLCDILLTELNGDYLVEIKSLRGKEIFTLKSKKATKKELKQKYEKEKYILASFKKVIDFKDLDKLFLKNINHKIWEEIANQRCLSCSNCVMVCPTCFCYEIEDITTMSLDSVKRIRRLDACQDIKFAEVHGGNFRKERGARLRQFVTHKMNQTLQYGMYGTVGCGRCIRWCPTGIDLTEITKEIQNSFKRKNESFNS